tara:strand:+ start:5346 stop:5648 length:303 start_codon:yes stop_codon:yes gene_type:complete
MSKTYQFNKVWLGGKSVNFKVKDAPTYNDALTRATNYIVKQRGANKGEFAKYRKFLQDNIEKGETDVVVVAPEKDPQGSLGLEFEDTYNELYSGVFNEDK